MDIDSLRIYSLLFSFNYWRANPRLTISCFLFSLLSIDFGFIPWVISSPRKWVRESVFHHWFTGQMEIERRRSFQMIILFLPFLGNQLMVCEFSFLFIRIRRRKPAPAVGNWKKRKLLIDGVRKETERITAHTIFI